jgi:hypothetical protein
MGLAAHLKRTVALVAVLILGAAVALPATAGAGDTGSIQIPLTDPANGECPQANYVVVSPGAGSSRVFLVIPPGPVGCPPGLDLSIGAGVPGAPAGEAVAEPLTTTSCQAGTDLVDSQITVLGETPGSGVGAGPPGGRDSACPRGDAAFSQLEGEIDQLPGKFMEEEGIYFFFRHTDGGHVLVVGGAAGVPDLAGVYDTATGTPNGVFTVRVPGSPPVRYALQPSGTAGVSTVVCMFCR